MPRKYKNPPIVEAVCEFQFDPDSEWDIAIPGLIYEKVKNPFKKRRQAKHVEIALTTGQEGIQQHLQHTDRIQFVRDDGTALIQVGPHLLTVNHLKPYSSWDKFLPLVRKGFNAYLEVANPTRITRLGLRYINRIEIPSQVVELHDYFRFFPHIEDDLAIDIGAFIVGIQVVFEEGRDVSKVQLANGASQRPNCSEMILDLDYSLLKPGDVELSAVFDWVNVAHTRIEAAFEACITDRLRQVFKEVR